MMHHKQSHPSFADPRRSPLYVDFRLTDAKGFTRLLCVLLLFFSRAFAADLYVAPGGVDNTATNIGGTGANRGSLQFPYLTINYAAARANPGDTIHIRAGTYRETIQPTRSGTLAQPIVFKPYAGERVIVTALQLINPGVNGAGQWIDEDGTGPGTVYRIQLTSAYGSDSNFDRDRITGSQVFVDGEPMTEARWPNVPTPLSFRRSEVATALGGTRTLIPGTSTYDAAYQHAGLSAFPVGSWTGGLIVFAPGAGWYRRAAAITGHTPDGGSPELRFRFTPYSERRENPNVGDPFFLMGRRVALDAEREFFFDTLPGATTSVGRDGPRHTLYLRAPGSANPATRRVEMRRRQYAIDVSGASHLRFEDLHILAGRVRARAPASNCTFQGLTVEYGSYNWQEELGQVSEASVYLSGSGHRFQEGTVRHTTGIGIYIEDAANITVRDTVISDCFLTGLDIRQSSAHVRAENVTVYDIGGTAISGEGRPHQVLYCHGYLNGLFATDVGTLNAGKMGDALNSEWGYNWMHTALGAVDASRDWYGTPAIRLDAGFTEDGPSNFLIHHNVVWNTTQPEKAIAIWALRYDQTNFDNLQVRLFNNTVDTQIGFIETYNAVPGVTRLASLRGVRLANNLTGVGTNIVSSGTDATGRLYLNDLELRNNLFPNRAIPNRVGPPIHTGNRQGATGWRDSSLPPFGFQLAPGSQAIDAGVLLPGITDDSVGAPDLGAFESGRLPFVPGAKLRSSDLSGLIVTPVVNEGVVEFTVSGLPPGRSLPDTFQLRVGSAPAGSEFTQAFDFQNHTVTAQVLAPSIAGSGQTLSFSLDGLTFQTASTTIDVPSILPPLPTALISLTPSSGTYASFVTARATSATPGATIRYTTNGDTPTDTAQMFPPGGLILSLADAPITLRARAFAPEHQPSAILSMLYEAPPPGITLFSPSLVPSIGNDNGAYELGVRLTASAAGQITAVRYYKSPGETGSHTGRVWSSTGTLLASAVFTGETASGWQQVDLATPVPVDAGQTVVVSVNDNTGGGYASLSQGFSNSVSNGALTATAGAGIFNTTPGAFPQSTNNNTNYYRDAVFQSPAIPARSALRSWQETWFGSSTGDAAPGADPDGDGLTNLLEYALGLDPLLPGSGAGIPACALSAAGELTLSFLRLRADLTYTVEASSTLASGSWEVIATDPGQVSETVPVVVSDPAPVSGNPRRFLRLRVTLP